VLVIEAMAQACGLLSFASETNKPSANGIFLFVGIDKARFKRPVEPGDQLLLKTAFKRRMKGIWMFSAEASVGTEVCATADIMCASRRVP
jgi:3-hydroxyacyl-[acyl-carrier-protein] dehydratase